MNISSKLNSEGNAEIEKVSISFDEDSPQFSSLQEENKRLKNKVKGMEASIRKLEQKLNEAYEHCNALCKKNKTLKEKIETLEAIQTVSTNSKKHFHLQVT